MIIMLVIGLIAFILIGSLIGLLIWAFQSPSDTSMETSSIADTTDEDQASAPKEIMTTRLERERASTEAQKKEDLEKKMEEDHKKTIENIGDGITDFSGLF